MKPIGTQDIQTQRLFLRKLRQEDAGPLLTSGSFSGTPEEVANNVEARIREYDSPYAFHWVLEYDDQPIGRVLAWEVSPHDEYCQLGYDIAPEYRSQGLMSEALRAILRYLLTKVELNRVYCSVRASNIASNKVCQNAGMLLDGTLRKHRKCGADFEDVHVYSLLRDDLQS